MSRIFPAVLRYWCFSVFFSGFIGFFFSLYAVVSASSSTDFLFASVDCEDSCGIKPFVLYASHLAVFFDRDSEFFVGVSVDFCFSQVF